MNPKDLFGAATGAARQQASESTARLHEQNEGPELPGLAGGDPAQAANVLRTMVEQLQDKTGMGGLLGMLGTSSAPILDMIASQLGLTPEQTKSVVAQLVPKIEQRMADDQARTGQPNDELSRSLAMLKALL
jgi:hypothetical protein